MTFVSFKNQRKEKSQLSKHNCFSLLKKFDERRLLQFEKKFQYISIVSLFSIPEYYQSKLQSRNKTIAN